MAGVVEWAEKHPIEAGMSLGWGKQSLIEQYNLGNVVREMRLKGESYVSIMNYLNNSGVIPNGYQISHQAVYRFCKKNKLNGYVTDKKDEVVNVYRQACQSLELINDTLELCAVQLDKYKADFGRRKVKMSDLNSLVLTIDRLTSRQTSLNAIIADMQEKIYKYETVSEVISRVMEFVALALPPEEYAKLKEKISQDAVIRESLRNFAPTNI